jgi:magnesium transporter
MNADETRAPIHDDQMTPELLREGWPVFSPEERVEALRSLPRADGEEYFLSLDARDQLETILSLPAAERRSWMRLLPPDDAADVVQEAPEGDREALLALHDEPTRKEVIALLAYAEDDAGGLMSPRFLRLRPDMSVDEAIAYLRRQAQERHNTSYYAYVLGASQQLLGVVSLRNLLAAQGSQRISDIMRSDIVSVPEEMDQETVSRVIAEHDLLAVPVLSADGTMKGIVTVDDIVDVVEEEATEDIQKIGGVAALETPYLQTSLSAMVMKRAGWLLVLFVGEMLTATAMGYYEHEIERAVVLALFIPLIISSGGNSGSQASTLVVRAMALGEVRLRDWWRVVHREVRSGLILGTILGVIGFLRVVVWQGVTNAYGDHAPFIGLTVAFSLVGVVLSGTIAGSMLPFALRRLGLDPATASAPFVATLVDVTGLILYFTVASVLLSGRLL